MDPASTANSKRLRTRKSLLHSTRDLVCRQPHSRVSIQDITRLADVGTGTFYNYFETKQEIFEAVLEDLRQGIARELEETRSKLKDPAMIVAVTTKFYFVQAEDNEQWKSFIRNSGMTGNHILHQEESQCLEDIERGVRAGRFRVDDASFTQNLVTGMVRHTSREISEGRLDRSAMEGTTRYILRMLGLPDLVAGALAQSPLPAVAAPRKKSTAAIRVLRQGIS